MENVEEQIMTDEGEEGGGGGGMWILISIANSRRKSLWSQSNKVKVPVMSSRTDLDDDVVVTSFSALD